MIQVKSLLKWVKEYFLITLGIFSYVLGWTIFLAPNNLIGGGVTGFASIVQYATKGFVNMGVTYFVMNLLLLVIAFRILGKAFSGKTIYAFIIASVGLYVLQSLIPYDICEKLSIQNGKLMSTIMGGIMVGVGIGVSMAQGGSTGGTDIIALIINKYRNISPGKIIFFIDVFIILSSLLVPSFTPDGEKLSIYDKITTVVYGFILVFISSTVLDLYLSGTRQSVQLFVLSSKYEEIADVIVHDLHRGVTVLDAQGWYTKKESKVLMVLTRRSDLNPMLSCIKQIDPHAFLSVSTVMGVFGEGFDILKIKKQKK